MRQSRTKHRVRPDSSLSLVIISRSFQISALIFSFLLFPTCPFPIPPSILSLSGNKSYESGDHFWFETSETQRLSRLTSWVGKCILECRNRKSQRSQDFPQGSGDHLKTVDKYLAVARSKRLTWHERHELGSGGLWKLSDAERLVCILWSWTWQLDMHNLWKDESFWEWGQGTVLYVWPLLNRYKYHPSPPHINNNQKDPHTRIVLVRSSVLYDMKSLSI
jgi:hypothetical protein